MRHALPVCLVLLVLGAAGSVGAQPIMPVSEVRPGMRGHGLTVLHGTTPERFDVEVIDVLRGFLTRQDLILIRMTHPLIERSGTIGGMSGSPIYVDGRLVGALAYGWLFAMDPIAGVTPIETMLEELDRPLRGPGPLAGPFPAGRRPRAAARAASPAAALAELVGPPHPYWERFRESEGPVPAATPLLLGGFSSRVRQLLAELLGDYGMVPLEAGGAGAPGRLPRAGDRPFEPGGAIGVQLVRGDISATAIGTVTALRGRDVLAFGHPMFNFGQQHYPVTTARILTVLASRRRSFKIGEPVAEAGALVQDRQPCIIARTGATAPMTPVTIRVQDRTTGRSDRFELEVVRDRFLLPVFGLASVAAALDRFASDRADLTVSMRGSLHLGARPALVLEDQAFTEAGFSSAGALLGMRPLAALRTVLRNDFERVEVDRLVLDVALDFRRDEAEIVAAYVAGDEPEAGARVAVNVVLRPFSGPEEVRVVPVRIPTSAADEELRLEVTGGGDARPPVPDPQSLDDVLRNLRRHYPATSLVVTVTRRSQGVTLRGHVAERLPPSALDALRPAARDAGEGLIHTVEQIERPVGHLVHGRARIRIRVRQPGS